LRLGLTIFAWLALNHDLPDLQRGRVILMVNLPYFVYRLQVKNKKKREVND
jgi:hypothetical protein